VERGGCLLAVHGPTASFKGNSEWAELLGATFAGHGPVARLTLTTTEAGRSAGVRLGGPGGTAASSETAGAGANAASSETAGPGITPDPGPIPAPTVRDEQYTFTRVTPIAVLAESHGPAGTVPCCWIKRHGAGRVGYIALGHARAARTAPVFAALLHSMMELLEQQGGEG
jgi:type 1 glutamine amidotransferase